MRTADADDDGTRALATRLDKHTTACAHSTSTTTTCAIVDGTRACEYERIVTRACPGQAPEIISRVTRTADGDATRAFDDVGAFGDATRAFGAMREAFARADATRGVFEAFAREAARAIASTTMTDDAGSGVSERGVARQGARGDGIFDAARATTTTTTTTGAMRDDDAGAAFGARDAFAALGAAARFVAAAADAAADMRAVESMATTSAAEEEDETKRIER